MHRLSFQITENIICFASARNVKIQIKIQEVLIDIKSFFKVSDILLSVQGLYFVIILFIQFLVISPFTGNSFKLLTKIKNIRETSLKKAWE